MVYVNEFAGTGARVTMLESLRRAPCFRGEQFFEDAMTDLRPTTMRAPQCWIAAQRMVVGVWFAKSILTKLGFTARRLLPLPVASARWQAVMPKLIAKYAADNPFPWYKGFLLDTVVTNSHISRRSPHSAKSAWDSRCPRPAHPSARSSE